MKRQLFLFLFAVLFTAIGVSAGNKAYVTLKESTLYILNDRGSVEKRLPEKAAKGDTVYATPETIQFCEKNRGMRMIYLPIIYKGIDAHISVSDIHPIRLAPGDSLTYLYGLTVKKGSFREQKLIPAMEWAMNVTKDPMHWMYIALIAIGCGVVFYFISKIKGLGLIGLALVGVSLAVMSGAEVMYYLSYDQHILWFLQPSIVNGWGHVILDFIILAVVLACQAFLFYHIWNSSFKVNDPLTIRLNRKKDEFDDDEDDEDENVASDWISYIAFIPALIGLVVIFLLLFNASAICYYILGAVLIAGAVAGAVYQFVHGRLVPGIIFPICYLADSLGLIVMVAALTYVIIIVAIVGALFAVVGGMALSVILGMFGGGRVKFVDRKGNVHTGSLKAGGKVRSDKDGKLYKLED